MRFVRCGHFGRRQYAVRIACVEERHPPEQLGLSNAQVQQSRPKRQERDAGLIAVTTTSCRRQKTPRQRPAPWADPRR